VGGARRAPVELWRDAGVSGARLRASSANLRRTDMETRGFLPVRVTLLLVLFFSLGITRMLQGEPTLRVNTANLYGVSLQAYNPAGDASFAEYLENHPAQASLYPFSAVVKNLSGMAVVGLALRWTWTDQAGEKNTNNYMSDGLFLNRQAVVADGDTLLVTPDFILPESMLKSGVIMPSSNMITRHAAQLSEASDITVDLDVVIFQDGSFAGPDRSRFVANIQARRNAAVELSSAILSMSRNGQDASAMIAEAARQAPGGADLVAAWKGRIARMIRPGNRNLRLEAQALAAVPNVELRERTAQTR
jgi:hypothetical protein